MGDFLLHCTTGEVIEMEEQDKIIEDIIDQAYSKGEINHQPCNLCGVIECATCLDQVKIIMNRAIEKGEEIANEKHLECQELVKESLSKIGELQILNDQLTDANREHNIRIAELEKTLRNCCMLSPNFGKDIICTNTELKQRVTHLETFLKETQNLLKEAYNNLRPCEQRGKTAYSLCHCRSCDVNREIEKYLIKGEEK